jgi:hypothetical protein
MTNPPPDQAPLVHSENMEQAQDFW